MHKLAPYIEHIIFLLLFKVQGAQQKGTVNSHAFWSLKTRILGTHCDRTSHPPHVMCNSTSNILAQLQVCV